MVGLDELAQMVRSGEVSPREAALQCLEGVTAPVGPAAMMAAAQTFASLEVAQMLGESVDLYRASL